jgi:cysteine desulfurase
MAEDNARIAALRERLLAGLAAGIPGLEVNGSRTARIAGNLNLTFPSVSALRLMAAVPALCLSTGSACSSAAIEPSYVLRALGLSDDAAARTLRIGIGRFTSRADIDTAIAELVGAHASLADHAFPPVSIEV